MDARLEVRASSDGFVRVADVDYSVPPRVAGRRLAVRASLTEVRMFCDGELVAAHTRSRVRADVVLAPARAQQLRETRQARRCLERDQVDVQPPKLPAHDALAR